MISIIQSLSAKNVSVTTMKFKLNDSQLLKALSELKNVSLNNREGGLASLKPF